MEELIYMMGNLALLEHETAIKQKLNEWMNE